MSVIFSVGSYGGFYIHQSTGSFRVCLGWFAITILTDDFDDFLVDALDIMERR